MDPIGASEAFEEQYMPIIIIGHIPRFSRNEQICLHANFACSANNEIVTGVPITKNPEFGLFAFRLTVAPSVPFYVRLQRWATVRMSALHQQQQRQQLAAETGAAEAGDAQMESITVVERLERRLTVYSAWSVVFIEWDQDTQKLIHTNATEPRHLFVGKYPTKKFPPSTNFCVRSSVNGWKVNPKLADGCQFPENSGLFWTWIDANNSRDRTEFKMVATIEDDYLNCTIVVWEPLPFMNKLLGQPTKNAFFILFSEWGVYDEKYTVIGLEQAMYDSKEAVKHTELLPFQESNPVSMWQKFLSSRTHEATGIPEKSASDTSLLTVEAVNDVRDEVKVVFCTSCEQKDLGRELEKLSGKRKFSEIADHVPVCTRVSSKVDDERVKSIPGEMVDFAGQDTAASKAKAALPTGHAFDLNVEKPKTYDKKTLLYGNSHSKQEEVLNPDTLARMCEDISGSVRKSEVKLRREGDLNFEPARLSCGSNENASQASGATPYIGDESPQERSSGGDELVTLKTFNLVDESRKVRLFGVTTTKAELYVCGEEKEQYVRIEISDPTTEAVGDLSLEVPPSDSDEEWLVSKHAIDSSVAEIVKENESPSQAKAELNPQPSFQTDLLANASSSDEPDQCCHLTETKNLECNAQGDIGKGELTQKFVLCEDFDGKPFIKTALASEICVDVATPEIAGRSENCLTHVIKDWITGRKVGDDPSPIYKGVEEQFEEVSDFEMDSFSVFPSADINDVFPEPAVAEKDEVYSPMDGNDDVDLPYDFTDTDVSNEDCMQVNSADNVGSQEQSLFEREESGTDTVENSDDRSGDDDACLISFDATGNFTDHPLSDTITSDVFGSSIGYSDDDASLMLLTAFGKSCNDTSLITRDVPEDVTDQPVNEASLIDGCSSYALADTHDPVTSEETRILDASSTDDIRLIKQYAMYDLFRLSDNDPSLITLDHCSSYGSAATQNVVTSAETKGRNLFASLVDETTMTTQDVNENLAGRSFDDTSLIDLDECSSYATADTESVVTSAENKGRKLTTLSHLSSESELDATVKEISQTASDKYSSYAVADSQNVMTSAEIKGRNLIAHSIDDANLIAHVINENRSDLSGIDTNLITLDDCSSYAEADTQNVVTSAESRASDVAVMELFPCDERHFKAYQYFVRETRRKQDLVSTPINRKSLNDLIPYFEADELTYSSLPEVPDENLNSNNETTLDFGDLPEIRGVTQSHLEYYSQSIVLGPDRERDGSDVYFDEAYSQELPVIPEEDLSTDVLEQCDDPAGIEYPGAYPLWSWPDGAVGTETFAETPTFRRTYSENTETKKPCTTLNPFYFEDDHYSSQGENDPTLTKSTKEKEDFEKILTGSTDKSEENGSTREANGSHEDEQDNVNTNPINEKKSEENLKFFRPWFSNCPNFVTQTYATLCESPPPPKTFYIDSGEYCFLDESESTNNDPDVTFTSNSCDLLINQGEDVAVGTPVENTSSSLYKEFMDINPVSERMEVSSAPALKVFHVQTEGEYQIQQPMNWTASCSHVKPFEEKWKVCGGSGESQSTTPPADSEGFREDRFSTTDQNVWLSSIEEESDDGEDKRLIRDLKDSTQAAEDSLEVVEDDESSVVFRPQLTSSFPKLDWDKTPKSSFTADFGIESDDFYSLQSERSQYNLPGLEFAQGILETEDQGSIDVSDEYSYPGEKVFRVPKCVLKGIVNYEGDYDVTVTPDETTEQAAADDNQNIPGAILPMGNYFDFSANNQDPSDYRSCFVRNTCEKQAPEKTQSPYEMHTPGTIRYLSAVSFAEESDGRVPNESGSHKRLSDANTATQLNLRGESKRAEHSGELAGRCTPYNTLDRVLATDRSVPSDVGSSPACGSPHPTGSRSTEAESLQLPGPESILHPCLEAWFCSATARNGKPNSFMIESEAQTEEESTGLLAHISENIRPRIAEGTTYECVEQVTRYGTAGFTIHCVDRCKSPIKSSGSYSGPEADPSESSISESFGNYSLTDSDSGEKCILQGTNFAPSPFADILSGKVAVEACSAVSRQLVVDDLKKGLTSDDKTIDWSQSSSSCEKSVVGATPPERAEPSLNCLAGSDSLPFEDDWYLDFAEEMENNEQRLKEIIARDPEFQSILQGRNFTFSDVCMDYVIEDDAFEEDSKEEEETEKGNDIEEESREGDDIEKEKENEVEAKEEEKMEKEKDNEEESKKEEKKEAENEKEKNDEELSKAEEKTEKEKDDKEESKDEEKKELCSEQHFEQFTDRFYFMDRPPSPFADDWFTDCSPNRFENQFAKGSKECEDIIRKTATALEKYYQQALAGHCTVVRQVKQVSVCPEPGESEKELTSDNVFLPGELPPEFDKQIRTNDSSIESLYFTPVFSPFSDDIPLDPCPSDSPDFMDSEGLWASKIATGSPSKDLTEPFDVPRTPVLDSTLVEDVQRCLEVAGGAESQDISVEDVPDNQECSAHNVRGTEILSTHDVPDIPDASFHSISDESSWGTFPGQEQSSDVDSGGSSFQSGPELRGAEHDAMDVVADCLVKKAIDFAHRKILQTTNSLPFNLRVTDGYGGEEDEVRTYPRRSPSAVLPQFKPQNDNDLMG